MSNIVNGLGQIKVGVKPTPPPPPLLLDVYPNAQGAFSLRKLRTAYTGYAIRVRRSSDNTAQDIGFDANGNLDTAALLSFVGVGGNGYVSIWYDQSGNNDNAAQSTAINQPAIVLNGSVQMNGNKPAIYWDNSLSNLLRINSKQWNGINRIWSSFVNMKWVTGSGNSPIFGQTNDDNYHPGVANPNLILEEAYASYDIKYGSLYLNSVSKTVNNFSKNYNSNILATMIQLSEIGYFNQIGKDRGDNTSFFKGYYSEIVIYKTNQTTNRTGIENNINSYYSIY
jgi:hypothetical protein